MREVHNVVNGQVAAAQGPALDLINPSTGEVFGHAPVSGQADVDSAVAAAREAYLKWRDVTPSVRQKALLAMADLFEQNAEELVALESENTGKAIPVTMSEEIPPMIDQIRFFAGASACSKAVRPVSTWRVSRR